MASDDGKGWNILKKANSHQLNRKPFEADIPRTESENTTTFLSGSPNHKKKRSFTDSLFKRTGSLFHRKRLDSPKSRVKKPPRTARARSEVPVSRDSFLERIDWNAMSSTISKESDHESSGIFGGQKSGLNSCGLYLPEQITRNRPRMASAPMLNIAPRGQNADRTRNAGEDETDDEEENKCSSDEAWDYRMSRITEQLYLGNDNDACDEDALRAERITHVLSMVARKWRKKRRKFDPAFPWTRNKNIKRKCVPMSDKGATNVAKLLQEKEVLAFMEDSQKRRNKLLVHCQLGQNRSPTIVMAFLMKFEDITLHQAWRKVKQKRDLVQPNVVYVQQLREWDVYLHGKHSTPEDFLAIKVSGEAISVQHEHANTERMTTVMDKLKKESSNFGFSRAFSSGGSIEDLDWDSPSPKNETIYRIPEKGKVRESYLVDELANSSNCLIVAPDVCSNSEDSPSGKVRLSELDFINEDRLVHVEKPISEDSIIHVANLATDLNID